MNINNPNPNIYIIPNPSSNLALIQWHNIVVENNTQMEVYDENSKKIFLRNINIEVRKLSPDVSKFKAGVYFVKIIAENKFIIGEKLNVVH